MRTIRIYQPGTYSSNELLSLNTDAAHHVAVVLRMQPGNHLIMFNGKNQEFAATIESVKKKHVQVLVGEMTEVNRESPLTIHLGQAVSKGERMELVMQKSVELGVSSITPLMTERSVVKLDPERMQKKMHQWQGIIIAACEQSGRNVVPIVNNPLTFDEFLHANKAQLKFILHPEGNKTWRDYPITRSEIALIIGPEGGLSSAEVDRALEQDFMPLSLGPRILRTETAAITALSVLQAVGGDL